MWMPAPLQAFLRRWRRLLLALAGIYGAWLLAGFFLVPWLLRPRLERAAAQALRRPVSLARVRFNPFTCGLTLERLRVGEREGGDWITLRRLFVNPQVWPLVRHRVVFRVIEVDALAVQVAVAADGRLNFQDLLEPEAPKPDSEGAAPAWRLEVGRFQLREGRLAFTDRSGATPFQTKLGPIAFRVDGLRTEVGHRSGVALEAWTEAKEHLVWKGDLGFQPLASRGSLLIENLALPKYRPYEEEEVASEIRRGTATLRTQYRFEWGQGQHRMEVSDLQLSLRGVLVGERGVAEPALDLPLLELRDGRADLIAGTAELASIRVDQGMVRVQRAKEGGLNLARLVAPPKPRPQKPEEKPFRLRIGEVALQHFGLAWEDRVPARPVKLEALDLSLRWQDFSLDPAATSQVALALKLGPGSLQVDGSLAAFRAAGDLQLRAEGLELGPLDPYLDGPVNLRIASGRLGAEGRLRFAFEGRKGDGLTYQGAASIQGLEARDAVRQEAFLRWKALRVGGADFRSAPLSVAIKTVEWAAPEGRLVVEADGSTNVARALRLATGAKPAPVTASAVPATPAAAPDLVIGKVAVSGGRLSFIDRSVQPNAALILSDLEGTYTGLSSRPEAASQVAFKGRAGGLAPLTISGHAMPLRHDLDTDVALKIQGADLTDFTPYTGKYLGYAVQKGKLDVAAHLRIDHRKLHADNAVKLDQFYLGEKVPSPEATGLPVKLGLALLRDRQGVIAFDLPIEGSLDDPDVKYGRLVWKAIFGLLGKLAASPFTLISHLVGGAGGDLSTLTFAPGSSALDAAGTVKLQALAKALQERPELRLEAEGAVAVDQDGAALRKAALEARLQRLRATALGLGDDAPMPQGERERWLRAAFAAAFPEPPAPKGERPAPLPPPAEMEQRLLGTVPIHPEALDRLADARVKGVLAWFLEVAKVDPERVFQVRGGRAQGPAVGFSLK
jgi:uncharacterized protein involved in outer membrane biogenesis